MVRDEIVELCAALDRQHSRDLFDVAMLLNSHGFDRSMFDGFLTYLLSHNRPISELMNSRWKNISSVYENEFAGMSFKAKSLKELTEGPAKMLGALKTHFTQKDFDFLYSFETDRSTWGLAHSPNFEHLPAIQWKLHSIQRMPVKKRAKSLTKLEITTSHWLEGQ